MPPPLAPDRSNLATVRAGSSALLAAHAATLPALHPSFIEGYVSIPTSHRAPLRAKYCRPASLPADGSPLIVLFLGGAFIMNSPE